MIALKNIESEHSISRDVIIHEAVNGTLDLYYLHQGEFKIIATNELKYLPHPDRPLDPPASGKRVLDLSKLYKNAATLKSRSLHIKRKDLEYYLELKQDVEKKEAKIKGPLTKVIKTLEQLVGALIVANYQDQRTKTASKRYKADGIEQKLERQLLALDYDLGLVSKSLRDKIIPDAIKAFKALSEKIKN